MAGLIKHIALVRSGRKYDTGYVRMLARMISENVSNAHNMVLFTDQCEDVGVSIMKAPLHMGWPGWWSKMELFAPWNAQYRPMLYFDLDTYVTGDIEDLMDFDTDDLWMLEDVYQKGCGQSAVMLIPRDTSEIWNRFALSAGEHMRNLVGDQDFLRKFPMKFLQSKFDGIVSYKADLKRGREKRGRVIFFHGEPKPHNVDGWAGELWTEYSEKRRAHVPCGFCRLGSGPLD